MYNESKTINNIEIMKNTKFEGDEYVSPLMHELEISVESGFAGSGFNDGGISAERTVNNNYLGL